jgi:hypothetical protein
MLLTGEKKPGDSLQKGAWFPAQTGRSLLLSHCAFQRVFKTPLRAPRKIKYKLCAMLGTVTKPVIPPDSSTKQKSARRMHRPQEHVTLPRENVPNTSFCNIQILCNDKKELKGTKKK